MITFYSDWWDLIKTDGNRINNIFFLSLYFVISITYSFTNSLTYSQTHSINHCPSGQISQSNLVQNSYLGCFTFTSKRQFCRLTQISRLSHDKCTFLCMFTCLCIPGCLAAMITKETLCKYCTLLCSQCTGEE